MRRKVILFYLILALVSFVLGLAHAWADDLDFRRPDHQLHGAVAYGLTFTGSALLRKAGIPTPGAQLASGFLVMSAGVLKEALDKQFSAGDLKADAVGVLSGGLFAVVIEF